MVCDSDSDSDSDADADEWAGRESVEDLSCGDSHASWSLAFSFVL